MLRFSEKLNSKNLSFRPPCPEDALPLKRIISDREVTRPAGFMPPENEERISEWFDGLCGCPTALTVLLVDTVIGYIRVYPYDDVPQFEAYSCVGFGYVIGKEYQNKGYGSEMLSFVSDQLRGKVDFAFVDMMEGNEISRHVAEKCGFTYLEDYKVTFEHLGGEEKTLHSYYKNLNKPSEVCNMEFLELAKKRYSVRSFDSKPIPDEEINKILEAARVAPTAKNLQPQKIFVIKSDEAMSRFRKCTECHYNAPLAFIICYDKNLCWTRSYDGKQSGDIDASIVTTQMMLEAASLGIGSTWVMYFMPDAVRREFSLPDNLEPTALMVMGYPSESAAPSPRHSEFRSQSETVEIL